jgi:hypothetical protein
MFGRSRSSTLTKEQSFTSQHFLQIPHSENMSERKLQTFQLKVEFDAYIFHPLCMHPGNGLERPHSDAIHKRPSL